MKKLKKVREEVIIYKTKEEALNAKHEKARKYFEEVDMDQVMALLNK